MPRTAIPNVPIDSSPVSSRNPSTESVLRLVQLLVIGAAWAFSSWYFGSGQELWVDETTQLRGLSLPVGEMTSWLAGVDQTRFDVPGDRMPPLSYWLGWLWSSLFGLDDGSLRMLSAIAVGLSALVLAHTATRLWGLRAGYVTGVAFVVSPNVVTLGVEIRAYPFLLLFSACAFAYVARVVSEPVQRARYWVAISVCCMLACYTHFFGLLLTGGVMTALLAYNLWNRLDWRPPLVAFGATLLLSAGIAPFVLAAVRLSHDDPTNVAVSAPIASMVREAVRLIFRTLGGNPSGRVVPVSAWMTLFGAGFLIVLSAIRTSRKAITWPLLWAIVSGLLVASLAKVVTKGFQPLSPSYNAWMLAPTALLVGAGFANVRVKPAWLRLLGAGCLLLGTLGSLYSLLRYREHFAHSAGDRVTRMIAAAGGPARITVLLDEASGWGTAYFPLRYRFGDALGQYLCSSGAPPGAITSLKLPSRQPVELPRPDPGRELWLLSGVGMDTEDLIASIRGRWSPPIHSDGIQTALNHAGWRLERESFLPAYGGIFVKRYSASRE